MLSQCRLCHAPATRFDPETGLKWCATHATPGAAKDLDAVCNAYACEEAPQFTLGLRRYCREHYRERRADRWEMTVRDDEKEDLKQAAVAVGFLATGLALLAAVWGFFAQLGGHIADLIDDK